MAGVVANSEAAICAKRMPWLRLRTVAAMMLAAGIMFPAARAFARQFGPPSTGPSAAVLFFDATLNPISGFNPANADLNGQGITAPAVSFNPASLNFTSPTHGVTTSPMSTVMTNVGDAPLNNIVISLTGTNPTDFAFSGTNNCPSTLAAGASCTISVDFTPLFTFPNYSATISVADNATGSPQTVPLTGTLSASPQPVVVNDTETIHTTDTPAVTGPAMVLDAETIHTTDTPAVTGPAMVLDTETIHTTDTPAVTGPAMVLDTETIHTTDTPAVTGPAVVLDTETIHTTDTPAVTGPAMILDTETIHTTDTPAVTGPAMVLDAEAIHTTDTPAAMEPAMVLDTETIHTTDTPAVTGPAMVLDAEAIHTTDTPTGQILTSSTTTVLTFSTPTAVAGGPVTFIAAVSSTGGTPTGNVTFYDGTAALGTVALTNGTAAFTTSSLSDGPHSISAVYLGDSSFLTSTSNTIH
jgi:hypothetical protein